MRKKELMPCLRWKPRNGRHTAKQLPGRALVAETPRVVKREALILSKYHGISANADGTATCGWAAVQGAYRVLISANSGGNSSRVEGTP